jgi:hypothetical protein
MKIVIRATKIITYHLKINALYVFIKNRKFHHHLKVRYTQGNALNAKLQNLILVKIIAQNVNLIDYIELIYICIHLSNLCTRGFGVLGFWGFDENI